MLLDTERLRIRDLVASDLDAVHEILDVDAWPGDRTRPERARWLEGTVLDYDQRARSHQPPYGEYAVEGQESGSVVGLVGLVPSLMPFGLLPGFAATPTPYALPAVGLFWAIAASQQRKGYATEAAASLVSYAFTQLQLARIVATTEHDNTASLGVMRKLGMTVLSNPHAAPFFMQVVGYLDTPLAAPHWPTSP